MSKDKLYSVQYLRGLAALAVVYVHAVNLQQSCGGVSLQENFYFLKSIGLCGVDIFFIISGFIICYMSHEESGWKNFIYFIKKKFTRINPVYYVSSLILLLCYLIFQGSLFSLDSILKTITIVPIFDSGDEFVYPILYVGWTLSYEWLFYIFYAVFIGFSIVKGREIYLFSLFFVLFLIGFFFPVHEIHYIFITNPMFLEFGVGMLIAVIYRKINKVNILIPLSLGLVAMAILIYLLINGHGQVGEAFLINNGIFTWHRLIVFGVPTTLLLICLLFWERKTSLHFPKKDSLLLLGDASFSIYLIHPILFFVLNSTLKKELTMVNPDLLIILLVVASAILGIAYHKFVEKKLISLFSNMLLSKKISKL